MTKKYTLDEILERAINEFKLEPESNVSGTKPHAKYRWKLSEYVKHTYESGSKTFWESAVDRDYPDADGRSFHFFTKEQVDKILYSEEIYDYFLQRSNSPEVKKLPTKKEIRLELEAGRSEWVKLREETHWGATPYIGTDVSENAAEIKRLQIMSNAVFELFFEPLDTKRLYEDMYNNAHFGYDTETEETLLSKKRLLNPRNYFSPKKEVDETIDALLDVLADKISSRMKSTTPPDSKSRASEYKTFKD